MCHHLLRRFATRSIAGCVVAGLVGCSPVAAPVVPVTAPAPPPAPPPGPPTLGGVVSQDDGAPAPGATIAVTSLTVPGHAIVVTADRDGRFQLAVPNGDYALAVTAERGYAWIEKHAAPDTELRVALSRDCHPLTGRATVHGPATRVQALRRSSVTGDSFIGPVRADGGFALCLPEAYYNVSLMGDALSIALDVHVPGTARVEIHGVARDQVTQAPPPARIQADLAGLVADITAAGPTIIGLGEATHGTAEFVSARGELTLALVRRGDVRLILIEVDAVHGAALDDYVTGGDVDIAGAVAALGYWVTDTYEFLRFLAQIRDYNQERPDKVHIWGVDLQNTTPPVEVLTSRAAALAIGADEQAALQVAATGRGKEVGNLPAAQRTALSALLARLAAPKSRDRQDLLIAVAARSLAMQLAYWDGNMRGEYRRRRDAGMAALSSFLTAQLGVKRACLWAHDGHITKEGELHMTGWNLAANAAVRYYGIGFYLYEGSARAWDAAVKIGVISHAVPAAPPYTLEGALLRAAGMPATAWVPLRRLPAALRDWLATPRLTREIGAAYLDDEETLTLRQVPEAFDAVVVIRTGHDSSPTPTGVRVVAPEAP